MIFNYIFVLKFIILLANSSVVHVLFFFGFCTPKSLFLYSPFALCYSSAAESFIRWWPMGWNKPINEVL